MKFVCVIFTLLSLPLSIQAMLAPSAASLLRSRNLHKPFVLARKLHINDLKNTYTALPSNKKHLSLVYGALATESNWMKNLYKFGDRNNALVRLIADEKLGLFHIQDNQLRPTHNKSSPAYSLTPSLIAQIIKLQENPDEAARNKIIDEWRLQHKKVTGSMPTFSKTQELLSRIEASLQETNGVHTISYYLPYTAHIILNGFMYKKAVIKKEMEPFYAKLGLEKESKEIIKEDHFSGQGTQIITKETNPEVLFNEHFEDVAHAMISHAKHKKSMPPLPFQDHVGYLQYHPRPDCVETAFRGVCNYLLSNGTDSNFDLSILPVAAKPHQDLQNFYNIFKDFSKVNNTIIDGQKVNKAWMDIVSGKSLLQYSQKEQYELEPIASNFIPFMNHMFRFNAKNLEELSACFSDDRRKVTFSYGIQSSDKTEIAIELMYPHQQVKHLLLTFYPNHAQLKAEDSHNQSTFKKSFNLSFSHHMNPGMPEYNALAILAYSNPKFIGNDKYRHIALGSIKNNDTKACMQKALSYNLDDPNEILHAIDILLWSKPEQFLPIIQQLKQHLPEDEYFDRNFGILLAKHEVYTHPAFEQYLTFNPNILYGVLKKLHSELYWNIKKKEPESIKFEEFIRYWANHYQGPQREISTYIIEAKHFNDIIKNPLYVEIICETLINSKNPETILEAAIEEKIKLLQEFHHMADIHGENPIKDALEKKYGSPLMRVVITHCGMFTIDQKKRKKKLALVEKLLKLGADPQGSELVESALLQKDQELVELLLKYGASMPEEKIL